jgi:hypothetical protein
MPESFIMKGIVKSNATLTVNVQKYFIVLKSLIAGRSKSLVWKKKRITDLEEKVVLLDYDEDDKGINYNVLRIKHWHRHFWILKQC